MATTDLHDRRPKVMISSRLDELCASRCAAFRAINDEGWIPALYENEDDYMPEAHRRVGAVDKRFNDYNSKQIIDNLVDSAHFFLGIYSSSVGAQSPSLGGLTPIEYEFLRFLLRRVAPEECERRLGAYGRNADDCSLRRTLQYTTAIVGSAGHVPEKRGDQELGKLLGSVAIQDAMRGVFRTQMKLFLKDGGGDRPLMYSLADASRILRMAKYAAKPHAREVSVIPIYKTAFVDLYGQTRDAMECWRETKVAKSVRRTIGDRHWFVFQSISAPGFLAKLLKAFYGFHYNVDAVRMGSTMSDGDHVRAIGVWAWPMEEDQFGRDRFLRFLNEHFALLAVREPTTESSHRVSDSYLIRTEVADLPGQVLRAVSSVAANGASVIGVSMPDSEMLLSGGERTPRTKIRVDLTISPNPPATLSELNGERARLGPQEIRRQRQCIEADLSLRPGVYTAQCGN